MDEQRGLTVLVEGQTIKHVVMANSSTHRTAKAIRIDDTEDHVRSIYGPPTRLEETPTGRYLVYDDRKLAFTIREDRVGVFRVASWFLFQ